ncbi:MAG TPA: D-tyrosyl-tRNA(Tyr) deacylase [Firmicutes bacterium]|nr:D-tyrosyl-tRNA(Tyr) deacylase [Bacillota bacterium]
MKAVVQRVLSSSVTIEDEIISEIGKGITALIAVESGDGGVQVSKMAEKLTMLRIFEDEAGKMNKSLLDIGGEILAVSNFTVAGDCSKGKRPSYMSAERPERAAPIFDELLKQISDFGVNVQTGRFGADMKVSIENDGPVTVILET